MAKDPAFLFYSSDFLSGISDLTMEERGQYITMLCLQHQKGSLSSKTISLMVGKVSVDVMSKFEKDLEGNFFNDRLRSEAQKRDKFIESRIANGLQGGRGKKKLKANVKAKLKRTEDENENENIIKIKDKNEIILPFTSAKFNLEWQKLISGPKWRKKPITALQEAAAQLAHEYEDDAIKMMQNAIVGNWQGLFALKDHEKPSKQKKTVNEHLQNVDNTYKKIINDWEHEHGTK